MALDWVVREASLRWRGSLSQGLSDRKGWPHNDQEEAEMTNGAPENGNVLELGPDQKQTQKVSKCDCSKKARGQMVRTQVSL